jgi:hypothetical protein
MSLTSIHPGPLPAGALLDPYVRSGAYTDCYVVASPRAVTHAEFVEAFYTTWVFKIERWLLARLIARPSTDAQAAQLAQGGLGSFAAWTVEARAPNQILLAAGRTRSWLMVAPPAGPDGAPAMLYFGSAVVPRRGADGQPAGMGWGFQALTGFHKAYSRVLLGAARQRLLLQVGAVMDRH